MGVQHVLDIPVKLRRGARFTWFELRAEIGALFSAKRDQPAAERLLLALIARQASCEIACGHYVGEARGIERGLGYAGADMGARHERGVAQERHPSEYGPRRFQIEDRLWRTSAQILPRQKSFGSDWARSTI